MISIVVPVFNGGERLLKVMTSLVNQNYTGNFEIVLVDDGSTDSACDGLDTKYSDVRVVRQDNQGAAAARRSGVEAARGDIIVFHDADDWASPDKVRLLVAALDKFPECGMAVGLTRPESTGEHQFLFKPSWARNVEDEGCVLIEDAREHFLIEHYPIAGAMNLALRKDIAVFAARVPNYYVAANDYCLQLRAVMRAKVVGVNAYTTLYNNDNQNSISTKNGYNRQQFFALRATYEFLLRFQNKRDLSTRVRARAEEACSALIIDCITLRRRPKDFLLACYFYVRLGRLSLLPKNLYWAIDRLKS